MRVLVTGGTGYLGAAIVAAVRDRGFEPVVFARQASTSGLPGTLVDGDVRDRDAVRRVVARVDGVIHAAALVSVWRKRAADFDDVNVGGLGHVLDACREAGIRRFVYTSSFLALPPRGAQSPLEANDYQRTKVRALELARRAASDLPIAILFPGVVYGPGAITEGNLVGRLIVDHLHGRLPGLIGADRPWSYAFVDDVAAAHVTALQRGTHGEFPVGGENVPQMRIFEILRAERGRALPRRIPFAAAHIGAIVEEARARWFGHTPLLTRGVVDIFRCDWSFDSDRSVKELDYRVRSLADGIRQTLASIS